jgi:hypothetical protein
MCWKDSSFVKYCAVWRKQIASFRLCPCPTAWAVSGQKLGSLVTKRAIAASILLHKKLPAIGSRMDQSLARLTDLVAKG